MKKLISPFCALIICVLIIMAAMVACGPEVQQQARKKAKGAMNLGHAYLLQGDYTTALRELLDAEKKIPDNPYLQNDLGLIFMAKKRPDLAEEHFKKAVKLKPDYIPAKNNLGTAYLKQKKWDQAIKIFKSISGNLLYATPHYPLSNMGWAYIGKKEYKPAEKNFSLALKLKPNFIQAIHGLATVFIKTGRNYSAIKLLLAKIKNDPGAVILHKDLAKAYEMTQQFSKAKKSWMDIISIAPKSPLAMEAKTHINKLSTITP